jgi:predicted nucleic acid-binding protein
MTYLVDANILSEPTKPAPNRKVIAWLAANERDLVVDSIILGELRMGILSLPAGRKRTDLERWFEEVARTLECLPWDAAVARRWAELVVRLKRNGRVMPLLDGMIAATALTHNLAIATRNVDDFERAGVEVLNPFG